MSIFEAFGAFKRKEANSCVLERTFVFKRVAKITLPKLLPLKVCPFSLNNVRYFCIIHTLHILANTCAKNVLKQKKIKALVSAGFYE